MKKPKDATHLENDGTPWKNDKGAWFWWRDGWGWCRYVGSVNQAFIQKFKEIGL